MPAYHYYTKTPSESLARKIDQNVTSSYQLVGKVLPSGKCSIGRVPIKKLLTGDSEYERRRGRYTFYERRHWDYQKGLVREGMIREEKPPELGLASVQNCHKPEKRRRYGLKGISADGRRAVRESAYLLERRYGRSLGFYTLTCPYTDVESIYLYNQDISYIQRSYFQELKRAYERKNCSLSYISVLEIQTKRFNSTGIPCLHIHYLSNCYVGNSKTWVLSANEIRLIWYNVLRRVVGGSPVVSSSIDAQVVRKSAVGYISKYLSKDVQDISFIAEVCPDQLPSQWWSRSSNVRAAVAIATVSLSESQCSYFLYLQSFGIDADMVYSYRRDIYIPWYGSELWVGVSLDLVESAAFSFREWDDWGFLCEYL